MMSLAAQAQALAAHTNVPRFDAALCVPSGVLQAHLLAAALLAPFGLGVLARLLSCLHRMCRLVPLLVCPKPGRAGLGVGNAGMREPEAARCAARRAPIDLLRVSGTLVAMAIHLNIKDPFWSGEGGLHVPVLQAYPEMHDPAKRLIDGFTVAAVMLLVQSPSHSIVRDLDRVYRKLTRQLPRYAAPLYTLHMGLCPRASSCALPSSWGKEEPAWARLLFPRDRWAPEWAIIQNLETTLMVLALMAVGRHARHCSKRWASPSYWHGACSRRWRVVPESCT